MTLVAVLGECTTTTCLALAATWPTEGGDPDPTDVLVLEADPSGGSLAGWLDTPNNPTLGTIVANTTSGRPGATMDTIESMVLTSDSGVRLIAAPTRTLPARRAIEEAAAVIVPALASTRRLVALTDLGRSRIEESRPILRQRGRGGGDPPPGPHLSGGRGGTSGTTDRVGGTGRRPGRPRGDRQRAVRSDRDHRVRERVRSRGSRRFVRAGRRSRSLRRCSPAGPVCPPSVSPVCR